MIPALIGVVLVILFIASRVAEDAEEEERREAAGDAQPDSWSWRKRVGEVALCIFLLPLAVAFYAIPEILF